ncbi:FxDxF family PEP-CTERM protein [Ideonella margarita]|uniref:FxDxF family PEP-CTERM protein n=1 Tax=Ideonella margarita TaxID=2984191 RepID=A0ABU9C1C6_9BURK
MKKFIIASALAVASVASFAANTDIGTDLSYNSLTGNDAHVAANASFFANLTAGTYSYSFQFEADNKTTLASAWLSTTGNNSFSDPEDFKVLFSNTSAAAGTYTGTFTLTKNDKIFLNIDALKPAKGGYDVAYSITPVPEPETYAMFAAGLAALGLMSRRRKQA